MIIVDQGKLLTIKKSERIAELRKLLADSDWTQLPDIVTRKGSDFVNEWKQKRTVWWNELQDLE